MKLKTIGFMEFVKLLFEICLLGIVIFAFNKCSEEVKLQRRELAVSEIYKIKDREFLESQMRLKILAKRSNEKDHKSNCKLINFLYETSDCERGEIEFFNDINYVFNAYENIGTFYNRKIIDKEILGRTICEEIKEFDTIYKDLKLIYFPKQSLPDSNYYDLLKDCLAN